MSENIASFYVFFSQSSMCGYEKGAPIMMVKAEKDENDPNNDGELDTLIRPKLKSPSQYQVLLFNDDYTPMEFVVFILTQIFQKSTDDAVNLMLQVHNDGRAICGIYPYEIAETKVAQTMAIARSEKHPLRCTLEKKP